MRTTKERPIIFSAEMVRAILEGRKTQTRRVLEPQPVLYNGKLDILDNGRYVRVATKIVNDFPETKLISCPYQVGDRLWVKETWWDDCALREKEGYKQDDYLYYRADGEAIEQFECAYGFKWRSPLFMPRWASRITLEITGLRVERLQDITQRDAVNEGVIFMGGMFDEADQAPWCPSLKDQEPMASPRDAYGRLWDSLNAKRGYAWESNPWVWVIEFKRLSD